jgi:hypothetical protein
VPGPVQVKRVFCSDHGLLVEVGPESLFRKNDLVTITNPAGPKVIAVVREVVYNAGFSLDHNVVLRFDLAIGTVVPDATIFWTHGPGREEAP